MKPIHIAFLILICLVWGFTFVTGKAGVTEIPPLLFTGLRYLLLAIILLPFLKIHEGMMRDILIVSFAMGGLHFSLFYSGMALSDNVSAVAILGQLGAPFATLLSVFFLGERVKWRRTTAIVVSFGGVMIIGFDPIVFNNVGAAGFVIAAAFAGSIGTIVMRQMKRMHPFQLQAWIAMISFPYLFLLSAIFESNHLQVIEQASWIAWGGVAYTALGASLIGHAGMFYLIQRYEVSLISTLTLLAPVFGVMFGIFVWGDETSSRFLIGGVTVLFGSLLIVEREGGKRLIGRSA